MKCLITYYRLTKRLKCPLDLYIIKWMKNGCWYQVFDQFDESILTTLMFSKC